jgi:lysophospholipase L1-like esterase
MKITDKQIREITKGAVSIEESSGLLCFRRLPKEIISYYSTTLEEMHIRSFSTAGIRFDFISDTEYFKLSYRIYTALSQKKCAFDIWVDGKLWASLGEDLDDGSRLSIETTFNKGEKHIEIYFPCLARIEVSSLEISDGATLAPFGDKPLALFFGDSITQGYTSSFPSLTYVARLCRLMNWDFYNFGVGADVYNTSVTGVTVPRTPDFVFAAYGTNDWNQNVSAGALKKKVREFFTELCNKYPSSRIIALLPLWRDAEGITRDIGEFDDLFPILKETISEFKGVEIIDGRELVPHVASLFADRYIHPNETGFEFYANALFEKITK